MKDYKIVLTPNDIRRIERYVDQVTANVIAEIDTGHDTIDDILTEICSQAERKAKEIISK